MSRARSRTRPNRSASRVLAVIATAALVFTACGDADSDDDASTSTTTASPSTTTAPADGSAAPTTAASSDDGGTTGGDEDPGLGEPCSGSQIPSGGQYAVTGIPADDADGGLVARQLPEASSEQIDVLAEGTIVDTFVDAESCAVTSGDAVWWDIGTPQLATGGWVNTAYLAPVAGEDDQDSFDLEEAQISCVYEGSGDACDLLTTFGYPADGNYGLGNSLSQAPDAALEADCQAGDALACAEQTSRGGE